MRQEKRSVKLKKASNKHSSLDYRLSSREPQNLKKKNITRGLAFNALK